MDPHDLTLNQPILIILTVFAGLIGACVGSFLNVVVYRLPREHLSIVSPPSHCFFCGTPLPWFENIPVLSWLLLRGKCRHCRSRISPIYPSTELLTGLLFAGLFWVFVHHDMTFVRFDPRIARVAAWQQWSALGVYLVFTSALLASSLIDIRHRIIPDEISLGGALVAPWLILIVPAALPASDLPSQIGVQHAHVTALLTSLFGALVGAATIWGVGLLGRLMFGKEAMGMGDVKLMALLGGMLGWDGVLMALFLACVLGAFLHGVLWAAKLVWLRLIARRDDPIDRYLPFGPYLALGAFIVMLLRPQLFHHFELFVTGHYLRVPIG